MKNLVKQQRDKISHLETKLQEMQAVEQENVLLKSQINHQKKWIDSADKERKALKLGLDRLSEKRLHDKEVINQWKKRLESLRARVAELEGHKDKVQEVETYKEQADQEPHVKTEPQSQASRLQVKTEPQSKVGLGPNLNTKPSPKPKPGPKLTPKPKSSHHPALSMISRPPPLGQLSASGINSRNAVDRNGQKEGLPSVNEAQGQSDATDEPTTSESSSQLHMSPGQENNIMRPPKETTRRIKNEPGFSSSPPRGYSESLDMDAPGFSLSPTSKIASFNGHSSSGLITPSSVLKSKTLHVARSDFNSNDFEQEIDDDLLSGKRQVMFPRGKSRKSEQNAGQSQLINISANTPQSIEQPKPGGLDRWLKVKSEATSAFENSALASPTPAKWTLEKIKNFQWKEDDFIINPQCNDGLSYAHQDTVRGQRRQCLHGDDCVSCRDFYEMAGPGILPAGPRWSDAGPNKKPRLETTIDQVSRHRSRWTRAPSPPGFWRSDFPSTQEVYEEKRIAEEKRGKEIQWRLQQALSGGLWKLRDPDAQRVCDLHMRTNQES